MDLAGRVALVTGAATGIGRATVVRLVKAGVTGAIINYRSAKADAERLADEVRRLGADAVCIRADVRRDDQVRRMVQEVEARFGGLDVLVNNAGITHWIPIQDLEGLTDEMWDDIIDVNVKGAFRCARAAAPLLGRARGTIVNVASVSGILAPATMSSLAYGAAKAALIYLTRALAVALAPNIRVNAVAPAFTDTPWMRGHFGDAYDRTVAGAAAQYPLRRIATPDDVAGAILGLVSGSDFVSGQTLVVDGGLSLI